MITENDEAHLKHPEWIIERRPCPLCEVRACGCPYEPELVPIPANITLGEN